MISEIGFAPDSPVERAGFEPSVPLENEMSTSRKNMSWEKTNRAVSKGVVRLYGDRIQAPSPEFEPDSKMVIFDIVLYKG